MIPLDYCQAVEIGQAGSPMHVVMTHKRAQPAVMGLLALGGVVGVLLATSVWGAAGAMMAVAVGVATAAAVIDMRTGRIPNGLVVFAGAPTLAVVLVAIAHGRGAEVIGSVTLGIAAFAGPVFVVHLVSPPAIGFGDVKLAAALGAALGLIEPGLGLLALCIAAATTAAVGLVGRHRMLPFGPGLVLGAIMALVIAGQLGEVALEWQ